jgi:hypothetical protein
MKSIKGDGSAISGRYSLDAFFIRIWSILPKIFRDNPFDVYAAFAIFGTSIIALTSAEFPEDMILTVPHIIWMIASIYMLVSSIVILSALFCDTGKYPQFTYFGLMWGWAFLSSASIVLMTYMFYSGFFNDSVVHNPLHWPVAFLWGCIGWAAFFKSTVLYLEYKEAGIKINE